MFLHLYYCFYILIIFSFVLFVNDINRHFIDVKLVPKVSASSLHVLASNFKNFIFFCRFCTTIFFVSLKIFPNIFLIRPLQKSRRFKIVCSIASFFQNISAFSLINVTTWASSIYFFLFCCMVILLEIVSLEFRRNN